MIEQIALQLTYCLPNTFLLPYAICNLIFVKVDITTPEIIKKLYWISYVNMNIKAININSSIYMVVRTRKAWRYPTIDIIANNAEEEFLADLLWQLSWLKVKRSIIVCSLFLSKVATSKKHKNGLVTGPAPVVIVAVTGH